MEIRDFNLTEAINGASIGFASNGSVVQYILDFKKSGEQYSGKEYVGVGQDDNLTYYFFANGACYNDNPNNRLYRVIEKIGFTTGTVASRGETGGAELISIESMQPREIFAEAALQSILNKIDIPILRIDNSHIAQICELSFKIAQKMMTVAAEYRAATSPNPDEPKDLDIDVNTLTDVSDKLLYNLWNSTKGLATNTKDLGTNVKTLAESSKTMVTNTTNIATNTGVLADNSTTIVNSGIKINGTVDTNVVNTPDVRVINLSEIPAPQITTYKCPDPCPDCPEPTPPTT